MKNTMLLSPEVDELDAKAGTAGALHKMAQEPEPEPEPEELGSETDQDGEEEEEVEETPATPEPKLDADAIAEALVKAQERTKPKEDTKPLTQEEIDEKLQRVKVTEDFAAKLVDPELDMGQRVQLLQQFADQMHRYSANTTAQLAQYYVQEALKGIQPQLQAAQEANNARQKEDFYRSYPDLKGREELVTIAAQNLRNQGKTFKPGDLFSAVAKEAERLVKMADPGFELGKGKKTKTTTTKPNGSAGRMNNLSAGGTGATASSDRGGSNEYKRAPIWD